VFSDWESTEPPSSKGCDNNCYHQTPSGCVAHSTVTGSCALLLPKKPTSGFQALDCWPLLSQTIPADFWQFKHTERSLLSHFQQITTKVGLFTKKTMHRQCLSCGDQCWWGKIIKTCSANIRYYHVSCTFTVTWCEKILVPMRTLTCSETVTHAGLSTNQSEMKWK